MRIGFEFVGNYWHAETITNSSKHHLNEKLELALNKNIQLIFIFEDEWDNKQELVKSRILVKLSQSTTFAKIHARKCTIHRIGSKPKDVFLNTNHMQGTDVTPIRYGAFYDDELVGVMTFKKTNFVKGDNGEGYELSRFCTKSSTLIRGLASKIFKVFLTEIEPSRVLAYADRRWNTGNLYGQMGFIFEAITPPSFWWMAQYKERKHRSVYMKHLLPKKLTNYDQALTAWENMQNNGFDRIWDCGTTRWVWELNN